MTTPVTPADHYTMAGLKKIAEDLKAKAAASGGAGAPLATYPNHHTVFSYRTTNGTAEIHRRYADIFYIVEGVGLLMTEGTLKDAKEESPGELRGSAIEGGKKTELRAGDVVHIPAGTPHHVLIAPGQAMGWMVIKIKERD